MTGLDAEQETILQIACFITDYDLNLLDDHGWNTIIHHDQEALNKMGKWCRDHHGASGISDAALASTTTPEAAADSLLHYIQKYVPEPRKALLAGNTVHADQRFLRKQPYSKIVKHLHHRILDVSAIKEAARRWAPEDILKKSPQKKGTHEARQDILESIEEARYYRQVFFKKD